MLLNKIEYMEAKLLAAIGLILAIAFLATFKTQVFAVPNDTVTVYVNITELAEIEVTPPYLNFTGVTPGRASSVTNYTNLLDIKNVGSVNVTNIWAEIDLENSNPLGKTDPTSYKAGGFLVIKNESGSGFYFVKRYEWNETETIAGANLGDFDDAWGWFKNTSYYYLWGVNKSWTGDCLNYSGMTTGGIKRMTVADDGTSTTRDLTSGNAVAGTWQTNNTNWSVFTFSSGPWQNYCVAISKNCDRVAIYYWQKESNPSVQDQFPYYACAKYIQADNLVPGEVHTLTTQAWVPYGVPYGLTNPSTLTIYASAA